MADDLSLVPEALKRSYTERDIAELEKRYLAPAVSHYYEKPLFITKGQGASLEDRAGKRYIDLFAGICTAITGYAHPKLVAAIKWQAERLVYSSSLYATMPYAVLAERLAAIAPNGLDKVFLVNSGSEANEAAVFMARKYTGNHYVVACHHGYHGRTALGREISTAGWRTGAEAHPPGIRFTANGYCFRCRFGKTYPQCNIECAHYLREVIRTETHGRIAAFIAEPIQGVGGIIRPPDEYFRITHKIVKEFGGLYIADEVQTGFGRTGSKWWGIEHSGVAPDIVTTAKGFGGGVPIGGVLARSEIVQNYEMHDAFATFGGNPLSCAAAIAVLEIAEESDYRSRAAIVGSRIESALTKLANDFPIVGEVRGRGMMLGLELVRDRDSKEPAVDEMNLFMEYSREAGLLVGRGGIDGNVVRIQPPLELTEEQADEAMSIVADTLARLM